MTANVGNVDRVLRFILGAVLIVLPFATSLAIFEGSAMTAISVIVGAVLVATALFRFCPLYRILGVDTCRM